MSNNQPEWESRLNAVKHARTCWEGAYYLMSQEVNRALGDRNSPVRLKVPKPPCPLGTLTFADACGCLDTAIIKLHDLVPKTELKRNVPYWLNVLGGPILDLEHANLNFLRGIPQHPSTGGLLRGVQSTEAHAADIRKVFDYLEGACRAKIARLGPPKAKAGAPSKYPKSVAWAVRQRTKSTRPSWKQLYQNAKTRYPSELKSRNVFEEEDELNNWKKAVRWRETHPRPGNN